jgi:hypothetical protein
MADGISNLRDTTVEEIRRLMDESPSSAAIQVLPVLLLAEIRDVLDKGLEGIRAEVKHLHD